MKQPQVHKFSKKSCIAAGMVLSLTIMGLAGCGSTSTTSSTSASTTQSSTAQQNQGQTAQKGAQNPALRAVMEISRLQKDQQYALTSDQKTKLKPILQELISTSNPSQDVLQQKADAINAVLTDQQKTYLTSHKPSNENQQNANKSNANSANEKKPQGDTAGKQAGNAPNPQEMYQSVLDSLS